MTPLEPPEAKYRPNSDLLSAGTIWHVAQHDLFGTKDVQDSPTLSYVWLADQFGHIGLGFIGSVAIGRIIAARWDDQQALPWSITITGIAIALWIAWKERNDFNDEQKLASSVSKTAPVPFRFNRGDLLWNCVTACLYTWAGAIVAVSGAWSPCIGLVILIVLLIGLGAVAAWWLKRKVAFQRADIPFLYRLANFPDNFVNGDLSRKLIHDFLSGRSDVRHLLITGPLDSGKTSLAVGIATEHAFDLGIGRYTTLVKLSQTEMRGGEEKRYGKATKRGEVAFNDGRELWPIDVVDLLIVDDLDGGFGNATLLDPTRTGAALQAAPGLPFFQKLARRRSVWVASSDADIPGWRTMITNLLGGECQIAEIELRAPLQG